MRLLTFVLIAFAAPAFAAIDFAHQIVPILRKNCADCHLGEKKKGGFSMNTRAALLEGSENGPVVAQGKTSQSTLLEALSSHDPDTMMPPKGARVPPADIALLRQWIEEGITWETGFTFGKSSYDPPLKPRQVKLPDVVDGRQHPIDRIIDHYLVEHKIAHPASIDDATFARRLSMDFLGLLPSPQEVKALSTDSSPNKRQRFIEATLGRDLDYAEHWITFWNDLLRNDHVGTGYIENGRKRITNWLYQSLVSNKPYDQFARELLAPSPDSEGFIFGIKWRGKVNASQEREVQFAQSISQVFLGINMKCASCHDSFIDRWKLDEAYALAAIYSDHPLEINRCDKPQGRMAQAAWLFPELGKIDPKADQPTRLQQLAALMTTPENGRFARTIANRLWHRLMGRGIVHPVDSMGNEPWSADLLDHLANQLVTDHYDIKKLLAHIATSQAYQSVTATSAEALDPQHYVFTGPIAKRLTAEQFVDAVWTLTGSATPAPHATVIRGKPDNTAKPTAQWIWSNAQAGKEKPKAGETITLSTSFTLPAKPIGATLVITADNEYSAFINSKAIGSDTDLMTAETYPATSDLRAGKNQVAIITKNAGNAPNLAGLFAELHLTFADGKTQTIATDASWQWTTAKPDAKGKFATEPTDWKPAVVVAAPRVWQNITSNAFARAVQQAGGGIAPTHMRAALAISDLLQRSLGRPNREQIVSVRPDNLTTLEAIDLENGGILAGYLKQGATKLLAQYSDKPTPLIDDLIMRSLARSATKAEQDILSELLGSKPSQQSIEDMLWSLLLLPEFQFVR